MSALPPKADMCGAIAYVRFGPIADIVNFIQSPHRRRHHSSALETLKRELAGAVLHKQWRSRRLKRRGRRRGLPQIQAELP